MYPNLEAERVRRKIDLKDIAIAIGRTVPTVSLKLKGKYPITLNEAKKIKQLLDVDIPLEELFQEG